jgi:hypothetical protein
MKLYPYTSKFTYDYAALVQATYDTALSTMIERGPRELMELRERIKRGIRATPECITSVILLNPLPLV